MFDKRFICILLSTMLSTPVFAGDWTVHTITAHYGVEGLEHVTPGVAYTFNNDVRVGALRNSYRLPAAYVAKVFNASSTLRFGIGITSGYKWSHGNIGGGRHSIIPLLAAEKDITENVSVLWFGNALNLEIKIH